MSIPKKLCFVDVTCPQNFIDQVNEIRRCTTPGCDGKIVPTEVKSLGLGGAISIYYACNGCVMKFAEFESSPKFSGIGRMTEISMSVQVAFIVAGCTHATYYKVLKNFLGIDAVSPPMFSYTIQLLHPVVSKMLEELCTEAKLEMRSMDQSQLGSWSRAVTTADGTWMTRGFHSKNFTFSVRNYLCPFGVCSLLTSTLFTLLLADAIDDEGKRTTRSGWLTAGFLRRFIILVESHRNTQPLDEIMIKFGAI